MGHSLGRFRDARSPFDRSGQRDFVRWIPLASSVAVLLVVGASYAWELKKQLGAATVATRSCNASASLGFGTNQLVASVISWATVHFHALCFLNREADREAWARICLSEES